MGNNLYSGSKSEQVINEMMKLIENLACTDKADGWISVDERLPGYHEAVICQYSDLSDGSIHMASLCRGFVSLKQDTGWFLALRPCLIDGIWKSVSGERISEVRWDVTHWQPLPEPAECGAKRAALGAQAIPNDAKESSTKGGVTDG